MPILLDARRAQHHHQVDGQDDGRHGKGEHHQQPHGLPAGVILSLKEICGHWILRPRSLGREVTCTSMLVSGPHDGRALDGRSYSVHTSDLR